MFSYAFYGYMLYNIYKYTGVLEVGLTFGRGLYYVYSLFRSYRQPRTREPDYNSSEIDWILIEEKILQNDK